MAEEGGGSPALAVALVPGGDLAVDFGHPDAVGPIHQPTAVARKAKAVEPHHIDIAGAIGLALFEDLAGFVDRGEQQPTQDLLVAETALLDPHLGGLFLDHARDFGIGVRSTVALFITEPAGAALLAQPPDLDQMVGDRHLAIIRVLRRASLAA